MVFLVERKRLMTQQVVRLEDWTVVKSESINSNVLMGRVFGHPRISDGSAIVTTRISHITERRAETENTVYILGKEASAKTGHSGEGPMERFCNTLSSFVPALAL